MIIFGVSTTVEQDYRHSTIIVCASTQRVVGGLKLRRRSTELRVSSEGISGTGYLGGYRSGSLRMGWDRIWELHFAPGGPGETGGLYVREGARCSRCILPQVSEAQAVEVIATIAHRFPLLLHGTETEIEWPARSSAVTAEAKSLQLLPSGPTLQAHSLSHALSKALRSITGREHESARRIY